MSIWYDLEDVYKLWLKAGQVPRNETFTSWKVRTIKAHSHGLRELNVPPVGPGRPKRVMVITLEAAQHLLGVDKLQAQPAQLPYRLTDAARPFQVSPGVFQLPGQAAPMTRSELISHALKHDQTLVEPDFLPL